MDLTILQPRIEFLLIAVALDLVLGDPVYPLHPIRLMGLTLNCFERLLRAVGLAGYIGGGLLFLLLSALWVSVFSFAATGLCGLHPFAGQAFHVFTLYSMIALGDLFKHGRDVDQAVSDSDIQKARQAIAKLVGRDTNKMDGPACRRAAIESLVESLVDGFASPVLFYALAGLPGVVFFKVVSTMDSMVGYRTERYLRFGWCGARLDDLLNLAPARLAWIFLTVAAAIVPGCSLRKAWRVGLAQHAIVPGPNAGWSEAALAGALERRLIGPIWRDGRLVTDVWIGDAQDPEGGSSDDYCNAYLLVSASAALFVIAAVAVSVVMVGV